LPMSAPGHGVIAFITCDESGS